MSTDLLLGRPSTNSKRTDLPQCARRNLMLQCARRKGIRKGPPSRGPVFRWSSGPQPRAHRQWPLIWKIRATIATAVPTSVATVCATSVQPGPVRFLRFLAVGRLIYCEVGHSRAFPFSGLYRRLRGAR
jgi:hypothetical protein